MKPLLIAFALLVAGPASATAELRFCNQTTDRVAVAVAYLDDAWTSRGWYLLYPGECGNVVGGNLRNRYYYYHAYALNTPREWNDDYWFCVTDAAFTIPGDRDCEARGYRATGFQKVDTGDHLAYTVRLTCSDCDLSELSRFAPSSLGLEGPLRRLAPPAIEYADSMVPKDYDASGAWADVGDWVVRYRLWRSGLTYTIDRSGITLSVKAWYWLEVGKRIGKPWPLSGSFIRTFASCGLGEDLREIEASLRIALSLSDDLALRSTSTIDGVSFPNRCQLSVMNIDGTDHVRGIIVNALQKLASTIDSNIGRLSLSQWLR